MNAPIRQQVLQLYRHLIRYGNQLQLTDKTYFKNRIRGEFRKYKDLEKAEEIEFNLKRGETLLKNGRIV